MTRIIGHSYRLHMNKFRNTFNQHPVGYLKCPMLIHGLNDFFLRKRCQKLIQIIRADDFSRIMLTGSKEFRPVPLHHKSRLGIHVPVFGESLCFQIDIIQVNVVR